MEEAPPVLGANHRRAIASTLSHLEGLLEEIEVAAAPAGGDSPWARHQRDLAPVQQQVLSGHLSRMRDVMREAAGWLGGGSGAKVRATWAIQTALTSALVSVEDLSPALLSGYGRLDPGAAAQVEALRIELARALERARAYIAQGLGRDLSGRLARLEAAPLDLDLLRRLEEVVSRRGLVEFRGSLEAVVEKLEASAFEVAVFGRVSSGKSSLLNTVLGVPLLPVGVTPVTAVPIRLTWGERPRATVTFAESPALTVELERLAEFVTEAANPDNRRGVTRVTVEVEAPPLKGGTVFVDTPGVGALATAGGRESYAYLPRCDLGILVLDAAGALDRTDLELLRLLYDSGIPGMVVLSKSDLLSPADRKTMQEYVNESIRRTLGLDLPVNLASTVGPDAELARAWFRGRLVPMLEHGRELALLSARRKFAHAHDGVIAVLRGALAADGAPADGTCPAPHARELALGVDTAIREGEQHCRAIADEAWQAPERALARSLAPIVAGLRQGPARTLEAGSVVHAIFEEEAARVVDAVRDELVGVRDRVRMLVRELLAARGLASESADEISVDLLRRPAPSFSLPELALPRSAIVRLVPFVLSRMVESSIRGHYERPLRDCASRLRGSLSDWYREVLSALATRIGPLVDPLRPEVMASTTRADIRGLRADLAALEARLPDQQRGTRPPGELE